MTEVIELLKEMHAELRADLRAGSEALRTELRAELRAGLEAVNTRLDGLRTEVHAELEVVHTRLDSLPLLQRHLDTTQRDVRTLAAAFQDFARDNATKGEIIMVHDDLGRVHGEYFVLAKRMETSERHIRELQEATKPGV
jgi:hypothetical protein